jgi:hypothetical protein
VQSADDLGAGAAQVTVALEQIFSTAACDPDLGLGVPPDRRFGTVDFRVFPAQFRAQIDQLCAVLADESKG